jgi:hypothetical protein
MRQSTSFNEGFHVEVKGNHIVVTFIGTSFCVDYPKPKEGQALLPTGFSEDADATSAQVAAFLSVARTLANKRAETLGWIE